MRWVVTLLCALVGGVAGYFVGVFAGCDWLMPQSNLCGIYGMMLTGPIGLIAGAVVGFLKSRQLR